jgi:hypothetical protein
MLDGSVPVAGGHQCAHQLECDGYAQRFGRRALTPPSDRFGGIAVDHRRARERVERSTVVMFTAHPFGVDELLEFDAGHEIYTVEQWSCVELDRPSPIAGANGRVEQ